jgi:cyclophilin family peptidyl-prolyl cis-trans isomerase
MASILRRWPLLLGFAIFTVAGCGKKSTDSSSSENRTASPPASVPSTPAGESPAKQETHDRLQETFLEATREEAPADQRPPDRTMTGKSVGKVYGRVVELWDTIRFVKPDGTRILWSATIETELGDITIDLDPQRAPNHVRNFICLAKAGYYDGLNFDRIHHEEENLESGMVYEEIEAGCPLGTGEPGKNSIGYWLKPEIGPGPAHVEGAVGACHGEEKDTAACKFYITLCKAPYLDGEYTVFGKVTRGLDVARKIFLQPVVLDDADVDGSRRPLKPVVMRKVTIHAHEVSPIKEN